VAIGRLMVYRQLVLTLVLVGLFWYLYTRLQGQEFFRWWGLAWTSFGVYLATTALVLDLAPEWTLLKSSLVLFSVLARFLQIPLLVFAAWSMRFQELRLRRWLKPGIRVALIAGALSFAASFVYRDQPVISLSLRSVPNMLGLAVALLFYAFSFFERWQRNRSPAAALAGVSCLLYALDQSLFSADYIYGLIAGPDALRRFFTLPLRPAGVVLNQSFDMPLFVHPALIFLELLSSGGICLGMLLLLMAEHGKAESALRETTKIGAMERARIARELHDGVIQSLIGLEMHMDAAKLQKGGQAESELLSGIQSALRKEIQSLRELTNQLRSVDVGPGELVPFLVNLTDRFSRDTGIAARVISDTEDLVLPPSVCREIAGIVREALANVRKHSGARNVLVGFNCTAGLWNLVIDDDGRGFEFSGKLSLQELDDLHKGPVIIKERVRLLKGKLTIKSKPGAG